MIETILADLGFSGAAAVIIEIVIIAGAAFGVQNHFKKK